MARAVDQIEQDLATLEEAIALLKVEFHNTYFHYLTLMGQAVRRQLILASYQLCTHGYPESFLSLSFNQRENLQQELRQLGKQAQDQLLSHLLESKTITGTDDTAKTEQTPQPLPVDSEQPQQTPEPLEIEQGSDTLPDISASTELTETPPMKPEQLAQWQEHIEKAIAQILQATSLEANRLLQQSGIIPEKLPPAVLEAAAKVEASTEATAGSPNLLNLLMESETEGETEDSTLTRIIAIHLRLSEIEFTDPTLSAARNQIRSLSAKGSTLQRRYRKKQRERAVAQAEAAWRASWFDD
ncbi:MAG TPA: hypothetical protein V6D14_34995 [Coleofasciculaceae cyanobacterium]|jgi:hypothetical protein